MEGKKKNKARITLLCCSNSTGTEKYPLTYIGTARKPRAFGRKNAWDHGFDYYHNASAWMTREIFFPWLQRLSAYVAKNPNRKILLLLDNFSGKNDSVSIQG